MFVFPSEMFTAESVPHWPLLSGIAENKYKALKVIGNFILQMGRLWGAEPGTLLASFLSTANQVFRKGDRNESWKRSDVL